LVKIIDVRQEEMEFVSAPVYSCALKAPLAKAS
jgi:hypothetical protein